jgi:molybdopterin-guanine dinucleotide biosynthesis protein A
VARTLGILVAGGRGRRLGSGGPKAVATLGGVTLLARALATLEAICDDVVVCAPASIVLPVPAARRVIDPEPGNGPLAGLVAGLLARPFERALALGVDLPLVGGALLRALGELLGAEAAVVPAPGGVPQPLAAWYSPRAVAPLDETLARGERSLVRAVLALPPRVVSGAALTGLGGGEDAFLNVNTPADLALAERRLGHGSAA